MEIFRSDVWGCGGNSLDGLLPPIIVAMSFNRLFLGRLLSSRACLRFTGCRHSPTLGLGSQNRFEGATTSKSCRLPCPSKLDGHQTKPRLGERSRT